MFDDIAGSMQSGARLFEHGGAAYWGPTHGAFNTFWNIRLTLPAVLDEVLQLLLDLLRDSPTSLLMVTHSPRIAARLNQQVVLHRGQVLAADAR